ncbi:MAG: tetratricopeptide repeat protein [Pseudomonadota bacterium]
MREYTTREVAELLDLSTEKVRAFARAGFLKPRRTSQQHYRFTFQDIVLLRTAKELDDSGVHPRKVWKALRSLKKELPASRPLTAVRIAADGDGVVVRDRETSYQPESGQVTFDFSVSDIAKQVAPMVLEKREAAIEHKEDLSAEDWFDLALDLENIGSHKEAREAYEKALELEPKYTDAHVNLGHLCHSLGELEEAESHYKRAIAASPDNSMVFFNLGVLLEDMVQLEQATSAYEHAVRLDPGNADAHYNLSHVYEREGKKAAALRHLARYKALIK